MAHTLTEPEPARPTLSFIERMRRLRGDFGKCGRCDEAFGEHERTVEALHAGKPTRVHPGCRKIGRCAACGRAIVARERRDALTNVDASGVMLHRDCLVLYRKQKADAETKRAIEIRRRKSRALRAEARRRAQQGQLVGYLIAPAKGGVESAALDLREGFPRGAAYLASNQRHRKAIALHSGPGQLHVEAWDDERHATNPGYKAVALDPVLLEKRPEIIEVVEGWTVDILSPDPPTPDPAD